VRLVLRVFALAAVTAMLWLAWVAGSLPARCAGRFEPWRARVVHLWARTVGRVIGLRAHVRGELGSDPCLLVANHVSYVDVVLLAALRPCTFVAKSEVARWPLLGFLARTMGTLFVERENKRGLPLLGAKMERALAAGRTLVLFPEGTSTSGATVRPFHSALLAPAVELGLPVRHATLRYRTPSGEPPAELAVCWWGEMTFAAHLLELLRLPGFAAELEIGSRALSDTDRKRLARRLHAEVARRLAPALELSHG
jgi:1-acyl-sn-glycerol-3-phosphate acyltransferase